MRLWMLWAAVALLTVTALVTLLAATRSAHEPGQARVATARAPLVASVGVLALLLGLLATMTTSTWGWHDWHTGHMAAGAGGTATSAAALPGAVTLEIRAGDTWFDPADPTLPADTAVNLRVTNAGKVDHDLTVPALGLGVAVHPGRSAVLGIEGVAAGSYPFECTVPGHAAAGMRGTLQVT